MAMKSSYTTRWDTIVDGRTGRTVTRGQIHYGNNGAHIVPDARN
uniref:Uncharacterized protein n=1 Tax=Agrobacterium albertimagni TaxID=147266 RepID=A0A7C1SYW0_9HYPH